MGEVTRDNSPSLNIWIRAFGIAGGGDSPGGGGSVTRKGVLVGLELGDGVGSVARAAGDIAEVCVDVIAEVVVTGIVGIRVGVSL
jgi:hypothetical protein